MISHTSTNVTVGCVFPLSGGVTGNLTVMTRAFPRMKLSVVGLIGYDKCIHLIMHMYGFADSVDHNCSATRPLLPSGVVWE